LVSTSDELFVQHRMVQLESYLKRLATHPVLRHSVELRVFLTAGLYKLRIQCTHSAWKRLASTLERYKVISWFQICFTQIVSTCTATARRTTWT
jgi:hypothetical protein